MAHDYEALRAENKVRYGTDIGRIGKRLLEDRYDKRTHFIFELLQNAEDALRRRSGWQGARSVRFDLSPDELRVSHFGAPFDGNDVVGICGIDQSTKDLTAIGRFGIGFKSVYAFTRRPEVHSGDEDFAIESYVWPCAVPNITRGSEETIFVLPFKPDDALAESEISEGLRSLGPRTLLFLREVEELGWKSGSDKGLYLRTKPERLAEGVRKVTILGEESGKPTVEESWLIFDQEVSHDDNPVGFIELAFKLLEENGEQYVEAVAGASLVAFFPTILPTHTGFLVQGPYRTTPSRDNVPVNDPWNCQLVERTGKLLERSLVWMRDAKLLDVGALRALPLSRDPLDGHLFEPLFDAVVQAFKDEALIPTASDGHAAAWQTRLARTQELRDLFQPSQLGELLQLDNSIHWVSGDVTADRTPEVRRFLNRELGITEYAADTLMTRMTSAFLEKQPDRWISLLYKTLLGIPRVLQTLRTTSPIIRLEDGSQVVAFAHGRNQAFLPSATETAFPTVKRSLCKTKEALEFFRLLRLTEPDPVDDVILNVLPRYRTLVTVTDHYDADIERIRRAFRTDSQAQRDKLVKALRDINFVAAVDAQSKHSRLVKPSQVYLRTERLTKLFEGVTGVYLVDDQYDCLRGEEVRELLESSGATRYLAPILASDRLTSSERSDLRKSAGCASISYEGTTEDFTLRGLDELLRILPKMPPEEAANRARLLWEGLGELLERRRQAAFTATYRWFYYHEREAKTDADFVRTLNGKRWVPTTDGRLAAPSEVDFQTLGWRSNPVLESKIHFKPPVVELLAREAGIDPAVLSLLKQHGLTDLNALLERLQLIDDVAGNDEEDFEEEVLSEEEASETSTDDSDVVDESDQSDVGGQETELATKPDGDSHSDGVSAGSAHNGSGSDRGARNEISSGRGGTDNDIASTRKNDSSSSSSSSAKTKSKAANGQSRFISYVAVEPDDELDDPDGLTARERNALEEKAIALILEREPTLERTPQGNKGFDLVENDSAGEPERWVEVKAMNGTLENRPVGMSSAQFEFARKAGEQYWLYVVESAGERELARIVKIQNPARRVGYFTFDRGWVAAAEIDGFGAPV
jgi:hypothetical protein